MVTDIDGKLIIDKGVYCEIDEYGHGQGIYQAHADEGGFVFVESQYDCDKWLDPNEEPNNFAAVLRFQHMPESTH